MDVNVVSLYALTIIIYLFFKYFILYLRPPFLGSYRSLLSNFPLETQTAT